MTLGSLQPLSIEPNIRSSVYVKPSRCEVYLTCDFLGNRKCIYHVFSVFSSASDVNDITKVSSARKGRHQDLLCGLMQFNKSLILHYIAT